MLTQNDLDRRFAYTPDKFDNWRVMTNPTGPLEGDCDDWANTMLFILCGCSWVRYWLAIFTGKGQLWLCKTASGQGHMMLKYEGLWIDNIYPQWTQLPHHRRIFWYWGPFAVIKTVISKTVRIIGAG